MAYQIEISNTAQRQIRRLPPLVQDRIRPRIRALAQDPRPIGAIKLHVRDGQYRIRIGDYRVIYQIKDDVLLVLVVDVGHRAGVYR